MKIILNGKEKELCDDSDTNITQLLESLGLAAKPVVIEHNKIAIFPRDYPNICFKENDQIEIINIAAGG
jgi:thiamine biosynthesis protein ThiS